MGYESFLLRTYKSNGSLGWSSSLFRGWGVPAVRLDSFEHSGNDVVPHTDFTMQSLHIIGAWMRLGGSDAGPVRRGA